MAFIRSLHTLLISSRCLTSETGFHAARKLRAALCHGVALVLPLLVAVPASPAPVHTLDAAPAKVPLAQGYGHLPLSFEANRGQSDARVKFLARADGYQLFLTEAEAVLALNPSPGADGAVVRMKLAGATPPARITGVEERPGKSHYFIGNDPSKWRTNVPSYAKVRYEGVYPGVDLVYYGTQRQLEYDFVVAPGADPSAIRLVFDGGGALTLDARGDLRLSTAAGDLRVRQPFVYQELGGVKQAIASRYVLDDQRRVSFHVAAYDRSKPLVIDPVLSYSSYVPERAFDIAVDRAGHVYVTGIANRVDFPTTAGAPQPSCVPRPNDPTRCVKGQAFVTKFDPTGSALVYSTYLGGSIGDAVAGDQGLAIAVDAAGHAYVTGLATSFDFPTTPGIFQSAFGGGGGDAFVAKLDPTGSALVYSTYLGGPGNDRGGEIAVDSAGHAYVNGRAGSGFPTTPGAFQTACASSSCSSFVTKLDATGAALVYSTYFGSAATLAVDAAGHVYVTGVAGPDLPTTAGAFQPACAPPPAACTGAFVTKFDLTGSALVYSTYLGGGRLERGSAIAVDSTGHAYVTGVAMANFPTTAGAFRTTFNGNSGGNAFVTKLDPAGSTLVYSTYLHGSTGFSQGGDIVVDGTGHAYVTGTVVSLDFPTTADAFQPAFGGIRDAFVTKLDPTGSALVYSTYMGGNHLDGPSGIAVDIAGSVYVAGSTQSTDFPVTAGAFQPAFAGPEIANGFVAKIVESDGTIGAAGGTISDAAATAATFSVPAGVLAQDIHVAIAAIADPGASAPAGFLGPATWFVSFTLVPNPSPLQPPGATITLPLVSPLPAGASLALFELDPVTGTLVATGIAGSVDAGGATATFSGVTNFSVYVAYQPAPFGSFTADVRIDLKRRPSRDDFSLRGELTLGAASDGIDPAAEEVRLDVGTLAITIPAGAFIVTDAGPLGEFRFDGVIDGVRLDVRIRPRRDGTVRFTAHAKDANLAGTVNPVAVQLRIGNDSGLTTVVAALH